MNKKFFISCVMVVACVTCVNAKKHRHRHESDNKEMSSSTRKWKYSVDGETIRLEGVHNAAYLEKDLTIPSELDSRPVTSIGRIAFGGIRSITSVTIPNGVTSIGDDAFRDCSGLTGVTIPEGVTNIGCRAFYDCRKLTNVMLPNSIMNIGKSAFASCYSLKNITIPSNATYLGDEVFADCNPNVTILNVKTSIGATMFGRDRKPDFALDSNGRAHFASYLRIGKPIMLTVASKTVAFDSEDRYNLIKTREEIESEIKAEKYRKMQAEREAERKKNQEDAERYLAEKKAEEERQKIRRAEEERQRIKMEHKKANEMGEQLIARANEKSKETFCIKGFYLGMPLADAKMLLMYHFPKAKIEETEDTAEGFDKGLVINGANMHFCDADENGKVKRLNFIPQILNQWFNYPEATSSGWLKKFANEYQLDFRAEGVMGTKECSSPFIGNGQVFGAAEIHQETYVHKDRRGFSLRYFGNKRSYDKSPYLTHGGDPGLAGTIAAGRKVAKEWHKTGWENDKGGAEGALRLEEAEGAVTGDEWKSR